MAWGQQQELTKEKLQELLGLDPEALKTQLAAMNTSITEFNALKDKVNGIDDIKASLLRLEGRMPKPAEEEEEENKAPRFTSILDDEDKAINERLDARMQPVIAHTINTSAEMAYQNFKNTKPDFVAFEKEIRERWDKIGPNQKVKPQELIENLYYLAKGKKVDGDGNKVTFFTEGGADNTGSHQRNDDKSGKTPEERATDSDKVQALKWGIPIKDYMESKESMHFVR